MGIPESSYSAESGATADETLVSAADVDGNSERIEQLLARLTQAVIAAHARIDAHADEIVTACEQATRDKLDGFVRETTERVDAGASRITELTERIERDIEQYLARAGDENQQIARREAADLANRLQAVNDTFTKTVHHASVQFQSQAKKSDRSIRARIDAVRRTAEDTGKSLADGLSDSNKAILDRLAAIEARDARTHKWIVSFLVLLLALVARVLWLLLHINLR